MIARKFILIILLFSLSEGINAKTEYQSHASIYQIINTYVEQNMSSSWDYHMDITSLDSRLRLPKCNGELEAFQLSDKHLAPGRHSIGVRCDAENKWSIYAQVSIKAFTNVIVVSQPLRRGQIITRQNIAIEKMDVSQLRQGYLTNMNRVLNKQATRHLSVGTVLHKGNITEPTLVKRGEKIIISANGPGLNISMQGKALMDGKKGQNIRVKNSSSGRTISAKVIKPGLVAVLF